MDELPRLSSLQRVRHVIRGWDLDLSAIGRTIRILCFNSRELGGKIRPVLDLHSKENCRCRPIYRPGTVTSARAPRRSITEKVEKLNRYFDRLTAIQVTVDLEHRENPTVELKVSVEHSEALVATDQSGT